MLALSLTIAVWTVSCDVPGHRLGDGKEALADDERFRVSDTLNTLIGQWSHYRSIGRQDSVIISAMPWFRHFESVRDTIGVQYTGISIAQAYVLVDENYDSTRMFIDRLKPYFEKRPNLNAASMYWTVLGHFALKYELDYPEALQCYLNALEVSRSRDNVNSQIVMLYNIVNIFYIRQDRHGLKYAEEAMQLSEGDASASMFSKIAANLAMAQMLYLNDSPEEALGFLQKAHVMSISEHVTYYEPILSLIYGDIFTAMEDFERAEACYRQALAASSNTEPSTISLIYLNYGKMFELSEADRGRGALS